MASRDNGDFFKSSTYSTVANGSATITKAASSGHTHYLTELSASSDRGTAIVQVKDNATVIWQDRIGNTTSYVMHWPYGLRISVGSAVIATVDGVGSAYINFAGYTL